MAKKLTYEHVKGVFEARGFKLLSKEYVNNNTKLDVICPKGHRYSITWDVFRVAKVGCGQCWGNKTLDIKHVAAAFKSVGYKLLSTEINSSKDKLEFICSEGHKYNIDWNKFQQGRRCGVCHRNSGYSQKEVEAKLNEFGYKLKGPYSSGKVRTLAVCPKGHEFNLLFNSFNSRGDRCPTCVNSGTSHIEQNLLSDLSALGEPVLHRDKTLLSPYELDIYIPAKNLAVEMCGLYWHSEVSGNKDRSYHYNKMKACWDRGVRLITVFEDEYRNRPSVVVSRIMHAAGCTSRRMFGRKVSVVGIENSVGQQFLEKNHLQGYGRANKCWGLFSGAELVAVASVSSITRNHVSGSAKILELKRLCFLPGLVVVGGTDKLFKFVLDYAFNNGYTQIRSYQDMRYGNPITPVYERLGFQLLSETKYTPHYIDKNYTYRIRNQSLRKTPEERKTGKTEWELRREQGYDRIWDCGHRTYVYNI